MTLPTTPLADPDTAPETLDERLESYGAALNFLCRELMREATLLRSRREEAERKARYRARKSEAARSANSEAA